MAKIDIATVRQRAGSGYPAANVAVAGAGIKQALGDVAGLTDFGVNLRQLPACAWSSQRHWHTDSDEFVCRYSPI